MVRILSVSLVVLSFVCFVQADDRSTEAAWAWSMALRELDLERYEATKKQALVKMESPVEKSLQELQPKKGGDPKIISAPAVPRLATPVYQQPVYQQPVYYYNPPTYYAQPTTYFGGGFGGFGGGSCGPGG